MLNISENLKNILRNDRFPMTDEITPKDLEITFDGMDPIHADQVVDDTFELTEGIISDNDIRFGTCRASQVKFRLANVPEELKGMEFVINQLIGDDHTIPLGQYKVDSARLQDDLIFKDVIAYDKLKDTDVDVSIWYNSLFPDGDETYTLKQFRSSLLAYLGVEEVDQALPNDDMIVEKTIEPTQISGRVVLEATVELNGAFGHINRQGKFIRIVLQPSYGLYPSETLYPADDLYPVSETDTSFTQEDIVADTVSKAMYESVRFEEYTVKEIDKLIIRAEEDDIGAIVGTGSNAYIIEGNFLVFGKSASELEIIAKKAFGNMAKRPYRPYEAQSIGLPYIEVGDSLKFATDDAVVGYVLQRTLTGIQALRDEFEAPGSEEREQNFGVNKELIQLQGKTTRIKKDVEGVRVEVEDLAEDTASKFEQTATEISAAVGALDEQLTGEMNILAGQIVLKVDANGNIAAVELDADPEEGTSIKLKADNISLEGLVTANSRFKILADGSMEAVNGKFSGTLVSAGGTFTGTLYGVDGTFTGTLNGNNIVSPTINGGSITGAHLISYQSGMGTIDIEGAYLQGRDASGVLRLDIDANGAITCTHLLCNTINGYVPINAGNLQSYATSQYLNVFYATNAGSASSAVTASNLRGTVYVSENGNLRPYGPGSSCGTSDGLWSSVWASNGTIQTSDERAKTDITLLEEDDRFLQFAKMVAPYTYKMLNGTSGRKHVGFVAQRIEDAMAECGISSMEFAGLIKAPVYEKKLLDDKGNQTGEYDTSSEIIDYSYHLRYDEHIPLIFLWMRDLEKRISEIEGQDLS